MSVLLTFSLGPVQPFIAQARKTRDLWMGSYLLSTLMRHALGDAGGELLFPALPDTDSSPAGDIADLPNRFVARYQDLDKARTAAQQAQKAIERAWSKLADAVWGRVFAQEHDATLLEIWRRQTAAGALFECYWAAVDEHGAGESPTCSYGAAYGRAQMLLDARKRLRNFAPSAEPGEKSTISGEREALHRTPGTEGTRAAVVAFWREMAARFPDARIGRDGRERLDAIDVIKRFAGDSEMTIERLTGDAAAATQAPRFPSTDTIAAAPFLRDLVVRLQSEPGRSPLRAAVEAWVQVLEADPSGPLYPADRRALPGLAALADGLQHPLLRHDGEALHPSSFTADRLAREISSAEPGDLTAIADRGAGAARAVQDEARRAGIARLSSYYALLLLDGDRIGRLLSSLESEQDHQQVSRALSAFARGAVRATVEREHLGRVVYAGGDDVLALVPLPEALPAARALRRAYSEAMAQVAPPATASVGLAVAHRRMPLDIVLRTARQAESAAKHRYGRNALAVTLLPRSGASIQVGMHWQYQVAGALPADPPLDGVETILEVSTLMRDGVLSGRIVHSLARQAPVVGALDVPARHAELTRLLRRHRQGADKRLPEQRLERLAADLARLSAGLEAADHLAHDDAGPPGPQGHGGRRLPEDLARPGPRLGLVELSGWLLLAELLARGGEND